MPRLRGWLREPVDAADGREVLWLPPLAATATMSHSEVDMTTLNQETAGLFAGSYPLGRLLGRGGMADVYASVDARTGDPVAVKVFRDTDLDGADRRSAEVRTLTGLRHPNLVELLDAGTDHGCEFLVMALVHGPTLRQACRRRRLPLSRTAQIGAAVGDALAYVHAGDVVHRDVKPDNVLLGPGPRVRLADFGIARTISATRATQSGLVLGTAAYLSPEQVTGAEVGPPADVYALALVLLECLTGHQEYPGTALESAMARLHRSPQLPAELPAGCAALLEAITATDPAARPSAGSAAGALHQLAADPHTSVAALEHVMGAPLAAPVAAAPTAPAAVVAPQGAAADADPGRPVAGDDSPSGDRRRLPAAGTGRQHRRRLLALAAATVLVLVPAGIAGERALRSSSSPTQSTPSTQRTPVPGVFAHPVDPPAHNQTANPARRGLQAAQAGRDSSPQPPALTARGSSDTAAAPAAGVGAGSPPSATSTPVAGPAGSSGAAGGGTARGGASPNGAAGSSTSTGPSPAGGGSPNARAGSSPAASIGGTPGRTSPSPSGSFPGAASSPATPSAGPGDPSTGPPTSGTTSTAPSPGGPTSAATRSGPSATTTSGAGQIPGNSPSASHGPSGGRPSG